MWMSSTDSHAMGELPCVPATSIWLPGKFLLDEGVTGTVSEEAILVSRDFNDEGKLDQETPINTRSL